MKCVAGWNGEEAPESQSEEGSKELGPSSDGESLFLRSKNNISGIRICSGSLLKIQIPCGDYYSYMSLIVF